MPGHQKRLIVSLLTNLLNMTLFTKQSYQKKEAPVFRRFFVIQKVIFDSSSVML